MGSLELLDRDHQHKSGFYAQLGHAVMCHGKRKTLSGGRQGARPALVLPHSAQHVLPPAVGCSAQGVVARQPPPWPTHTTHTPTTCCAVLCCAAGRPFIILATEVMRNTATQTGVVMHFQVCGGCMGLVGSRGRRHGVGQGRDRRAAGGGRAGRGVLCKGRSLLQ